MRTFLSATVLAAALAALAFPLSASEWSKTYSTPGVADIDLDVDDGSITLLSGSAHSVEVRVTTRGYEIRQGAVEVVESHDGNVVHVHVVVPKHLFRLSMGQHSIRAEVRVPDGAMLKVRTGDGSVRADGVRGSLRFESGDGSIEGRGLDGTLEANTGDGSVNVEGRFDVLRVRTGDGSITASVASGSKVTSDWEANTGDGSISLRLPASIACDLNVHTGDGNLNIDFPVTTGSVLSKHDISGKVNGGGAPFRIRTGDGSITIAKI